jgi:hypothetical protein
MGALSGAGGGETLGGRAQGAATGGVLGGAIGAVAPGASDLVVRGARAASEPLRRGMRRTFNPDREAERQVATTLHSDRVNDPGAATRLPPGEFPEGSRLVDLGSNSTRRLLDRAASLSPEGDTVVRNALQHRAEGEQSRFVRWAQHTFNFPNPRATEAAIVRESRTIVGPAYRQAYADGDRAIMSPALEQLLSSPHVEQALAAAVKKGKTIAVAEGHGGFNPRVTVTADGRVNFNGGQGGVPAYPNLQLWDYTKRELDGVVAKLHRDGLNDEARYVGQVRTMLRDELDRQVPSYAGARQAATEFFGATNASEAGAAFFGTGKTFGSTAEAREAIQAMNPLQRQLFQDAYVGRFIHSLENLKDRGGSIDQVWKRIANNPNAREELDVALTPALRTELEAMTRIEQVWSRARDQVTGNSATARRTADIQAGVAGTAGLTATAAGAYHQDTDTTAIGAVVAALAGSRRFNERRVAERVARLLMSDNPQAAHQAAAMIARSDRMMNRLREATSGAGSRGVPPQTTGIAGPQAGSVSRADDNGDDVPGPRQQER